MFPKTTWGPVGSMSRPSAPCFMNFDASSSRGHAAGRRDNPINGASRHLLRFLRSSSTRARRISTCSRSASPVLRSPRSCGRVSLSCSPAKRVATDSYALRVAFEKIPPACSGSPPGAPEKLLAYGAARDVPPRGRLKLLRPQMIEHLESRKFDSTPNRPKSGPASSLRLLNVHTPLS